MMSPETRTTVNVRDVAAKVIDGEAIIMNLSNGLYYSMDNVGAVVWELLGRGQSLDEIADVLTGLYRVERATAMVDVQRLVRELLDENLMTIGALAPGRDAPPPRLADQRPYEPPTLHKYADMADLLALDPPMPNVHTGHGDG